jgi:arsenate reductase-like glutaredoxin family protein
MTIKKGKSNLSEFGISIHSHKVKRKITQKDLLTDLVKEVGTKINISDNINDGRQFNN